jgi:hypothetical protein
MKNLIFAFLAMFALSFWSCTGENQQESSQNELTDTIEEVADSAIEVTGVAVDGAMNSVYLKVGDDTIEFSYPDLDSDHRASWTINDTLTVRYVETAEGDSVTDVINKSDA